MCNAKKKKSKEKSQFKKFKTTILLTTINSN